MHAQQLLSLIKTAAWTNVMLRMPEMRKKGNQEFPDFFGKSAGSSCDNSSCTMCSKLVKALSGLPISCSSILVFYLFIHLNIACK
jgi:hypothetical protein